MKLLEINKNGTEMYQLKDGRLGKIYRSGYVRVTILRNGIRDGEYFQIDSTKNSRWYQINKVVSYKGKFGKQYKRLLLAKHCDKVSLLKRFEDKNCDKMSQELKTLRIYIKSLQWYIDNKLKTITNR